MGRTINEIITVDYIQGLLDKVDDYPWQAEGEKEARRRVLELIQENFPFEQVEVPPSLHETVSDFAALIGASLPKASQFVMSQTFYELLSIALQTIYFKGGRDVREQQ